MTGLTDLIELTLVGGQLNVNRSLETVGFIGLGQMGDGKAKNLLLAGVDLMVYDLLQDVTDKYVQLGAHIAKSSTTIATLQKNISLPSVHAGS